MQQRTRIIVWSSAALVVALLLAFTVLNKGWWKNRVVNKWGGSNPHLKEAGEGYWNGMKLIELVSLYYLGYPTWEPPGPAPSGTGSFSGTL